VISTAIPTPVLLRAAPQLAALAILDAALFTAEEVLLAHHPALADLDGILHGERAPPDGCLVPILIAHFDELRHLLGRYRIDVRTALLADDDDIPF
jgi:hypothetical protein